MSRLVEKFWNSGSTFSLENKSNLQSQDQRVRAETMSRSSPLKNDKPVNNILWADGGQC